MALAALPSVALIKTGPSLPQIWLHPPEEHRSSFVWEQCRRTCRACTGRQAFQLLQARAEQQGRGGRFSAPGPDNTLTRKSRNARAALLRMRFFHALHALHADRMRPSDVPRGVKHDSGWLVQTQLGDGALEIIARSPKLLRAPERRGAVDASYSRVLEYEALWEGEGLS